MLGPIPGYLHEVPSRNLVYLLTGEWWAMLNVPSMMSLLFVPDMACDKGVSEVAGNMQLPSAC